MSAKIAVVTGANKGIGFAIVKGLCQRFNGLVYLTSRDEKRGKAAVDELRKLGLSPEYHQLDVSDRASVTKFAEHLKHTHGGLDILINNAGLASGIIKGSYEEEKSIIDLNYRSVLIMQELVYPLVRENGRILNISSTCGHLSNIRNKYWLERLSSKDLTVRDLNEFVQWFLDSSRNKTLNRQDLADNGTLAAYRVSKVALSALTIVQQKELETKNISVNSVHPGFVRTDMTSGVGVFTPDEAAETPLYIVLDAPQSLQGSYLWYDRKVLDWYDYTADYYFKISSTPWLLFSTMTANVKRFFLKNFKSK